MRIYTEVNFEWDDDQNQLVETSSKSFDYSGPIALCKKETTTWNTRWYDDAGRVYKIKVRKHTKKTNAIRRAWIYVSEDGGTTWKEDYYTGENRKPSETHDMFKTYVANRSTSSNKAHGTKGTDDEGMAWQSFWGGEFGGDNVPTDDTALNQKYLDTKAGTVAEGEEIFYEVEGGEGVSQSIYDALSAEEKDLYFFNEEQGIWLKKAASYLSDEQMETVVSKETKYAEEALRGYIADWEKLTNTGIENTDEFQREVIAATKLMKEEEGKVISAFEDYEKFIGRAETDYETDVERLIGEEGTLTVDEEAAIEAYETDVERLIGKTWFDPNSGEWVDANAALDRGIITQEEYDQSAGTYQLDIRAQQKIREEGLEGTITTREEELEALRTEAKGEIRAAEARIGAAGFAPSGVGRTARAMLAEEIGGAAEDIETGFTEEREDIKEGYLEDVKPIEKGKITALEDYLETKTGSLELIETTKTTTMEDYLETRTEAGEDLPEPWETATEDYQSLLTSYGIGTDLDISPYADITARAEGALAGVQANIELLIANTRLATAPYDYEWDPWTEAGGFAEAGAAMGFKPGTPYDRGFISAQNLFEPTITEYGFTPSEDLPLYDPNYPLPWEDVGLGEGEPDISGGIF